MTEAEIELKKQRPNFTIVLRYLRQAQGERTVKIGPYTYGMYNDRLCHVLLVYKNGQWLTGPPDEERWCVSDISLNDFMADCDKISEDDMVQMIASIALTEINREDRRRASR